MIDRSLRDAFGVLYCPFWSFGVELRLDCRYTPVSSARFLTGGVSKCDILLIVDLWQYCT